MQTDVCPFAGANNTEIKTDIPFTIGTTSGSVLGYMVAHGTAKGFSAAVLKAAGIANPTALEKHVAFFGSEISGNINKTCMNEGLLALGVSKVQSCATAVLFTNKLASKEEVDKEHVSIALIYKGERSCATRIFDEAGRVNEEQFQTVFGSLEVITPNDFDNIIALNSKRDQPDSILKVTEYVRWFFDAKIAAPGEAKTLFHLIADIKNTEGIAFAISRQRMHDFFEKADEIWEEVADKVAASKNIT